MLWPSSRGRSHGSGRWSRRWPTRHRRAGRRARAPPAPARSTTARSAPTSAGAAHPDAVHRHVQGCGLEGGPGRADGGEDAAPVGVVAEDRALEEVVAGDGAGDLEGVVDARGADDLDRDVVGGALRVARCSCRARSRRRRSAPPSSSPGRRPTPGRAGGEERRPCRWSTCSRRSRCGRTRRASRRAGPRRGPPGRRRRPWSGRRASSRGPGRACPRPWPCRRRDQPVPACTGHLVHRVGRHDRDRRGLVALRRESAAAAASTPARSLSIGSSSPIRPVEQTSDVTRRARRGRRRRARRCGACRGSPACPCRRWRRRS